MRLEHLIGATVFVLDGDLKCVGEVEIERYLPSEKSYRVWWTYPQTQERELIKIPEWRLVRKTGETVTRVIR
jgi:hypothetical protein